MNAYLKSRNRLFALGVLLALSFAAAGRNVAQEERTDRQAWPKEVQAVGARITIYEPQVESLKGTQLSTRAALSIVPGGSTEPVFGAIWLEATLATDPDGRTARPENLRLAELRFPGGLPACARRSRRRCPLEVTYSWTPCWRKFASRKIGRPRPRSGRHSRDQLPVPSGGDE
jgi:hypothetical protein